MKYIIIGGVAGGATTAARLRRNDEKAEIIMMERGEHISYANCGLPYYLGGVISDRDRLFVQDPVKFKDMLNVEVRNFTEVLSINKEDKTILVLNRKTGEEYSESYDKLVLSPGASPVKPPIPGIQHPQIYTVRNVEDTDQVHQFIQNEKPQKAVIVGAGFIGLEMAENLHELGMQVTIVEMSQQVMTMLDYEMAALVHQHLKTKGVEFYLKDGVSSFKSPEDDQKLVVTLSSGREIKADMVILSIGVRPETALAKKAGLKLGPKGGIWVDPYLQTSDKDIYAVGDAIEFENPLTGQTALANLAGPANKQGRICADNIVMGNKKTYKGSIGSAVAKVFDLTVASTGCSEKQLENAEVEFLTCITHSSSHAGYYPGALPLTVKIMFSPINGKLLGGQIIGYDGVDKRIDMLATSLHHGGTIYDLTEIEHAYAPPYSSAKDPVNIAGYVAENMLAQKTRHITWKELLKEDSKELFLVDVRLPEEFALGSIDQAKNIPQNETRQRLAEFPRDKKIVLFCGVGLRAYLSEQILRGYGFDNVYNLSGGFKTYEHAISKQSNEGIYENDYIGKDDHIYQTNVDAPATASIPTIDVIKVDACGLQCPGPIMKLKENVEKIAPGQILEETANDPGFEKDVQSWCKMTGNKLLSLNKEKGVIKAQIQKSSAKSEEDKDTTLVVFSDDFDKALASFVIANGAASAGKEVTLFFTFWGLNVIKKAQKPSVSKGFLGKMFGMMLPSHSRKLKLSSLHMGGMGTKMMRMIMKNLRIDSLEDMIGSAQQNGVKFVACQMSMDVMGIKKEELLEGVEIGGVATMLEKTDSSRGTFFI